MLAQKEELELDILKAQLNPHFLFNSLNTLFGLAKRDNKETASAILKLSDILRYVIYESNTSQINISREINFLKYFIEFAKFKNRDAKVNFEVKLDNAHYAIAPLILLPFVENAVKHGLNSNVPDSWIEITISVTNNLLYFKCSNSHFRDVIQTDFNFSIGGSGLKNIKKRLELLYDTNYKLDFEADNKTYTVSLEIDLGKI